MLSISPLCRCHPSHAPGASWFAIKILNSRYSENPILGLVFSSPCPLRKRLSLCFWGNSVNLTLTSKISAAICFFQGTHQSLHRHSTPMSFKRLFHCQWQFSMIDVSHKLMGVFLYYPIPNLWSVVASALRLLVCRGCESVLPAWGSSASLLDLAPHCVFTYNFALLKHLVPHAGFQGFTPRCLGRTRLRVTRRKPGPWGGWIGLVHVLNWGKRWGLSYTGADHSLTSVILGKMPNRGWSHSCHPEKSHVSIQYCI